MPPPQSSQPDFTNALPSSDISEEYSASPGAGAAAAAWIDRRRTFQGKPLWVWAEGTRSLFGRMLRPGDDDRFLSVLMLLLLSDFAEHYNAAVADVKEKELATDAAVGAMLIAAEDPARFRVRAFRTLQGMTRAEADEAQRLSGEIFSEARQSETVPAEADGEGAPGKSPRRSKRSSRGSAAENSGSSSGNTAGTSPSPA